MDIEPRKIRIVTGSAEEVEATVNSLLDEYSPVSWTFAFDGGKAMVVCLLIHAAEMRKAAIASAALAPGPRRPS